MFWVYNRVVHIVTILILYCADYVEYNSIQIQIDIYGSFLANISM